MARLSRSQQQVRQRISQLAASGLNPGDLGRAFMLELEKTIPNDGYRLFGIDPGTLLINRLLVASDSDAGARREWLREVYLASEPLTYIELPNLMRLSLTSVAVHERKADCLGYPAAALDHLSDREHYHAFHELRSPVGGTLLGAFPADGRWVAALQLYRRDPRQPFRKTDVDFLRLLAPTIGSSLAAALAREQALASAPDLGSDVSGILLLKPDGELEFSTPAGEEWRRRLLAHERGGGPLPTAIWSAMARARTDPAGAATVVAPTSEGLLRVEASRGGADGQMAVVLSQPRPPSVTSLTLAWSLTPAESRVVELALGGRSNLQIAAALFVSENTVQTHLRHIYEKLGIGSRTQLLARFFRESVTLPE